MKEAVNSETAHKSAKKSCCDHSKKLIIRSSQLKVVKPKVYITDSSSFKVLVQELTGKSRELISSSGFPSSHHEMQQRYTTSSPTIQSIAHSSTSNFLEEVCEERVMTCLSPLTAFALEQGSWLGPQEQEVALGQMNELWYSMEDNHIDFLLNNCQEDELLPCLESFDQQLQDLYSIIHS